MTTIRRNKPEPRLLRSRCLKVNAAAWLFCACAAVWAPSLSAPSIAQTPTAAPAPQPQSGERFEVWRAGFTERAAAAGHDRALIARTLAGVEPDLSILELDRNQPEFVRPIWGYLDSAVSDSRQANGRARQAQEDALLQALETRWGVPAETITAVWGLESAYGAVIGDRDVVRSLATLAWDGRRRTFFERELMAVLQILAAGDAVRSDLIGGWAGAMGQTQFMPSTYVAYAVDYDEDGRKNVWADRGDALGSAAFYLARHGWRAGEPWGVEVVVPAGFNYALADGRRNSVAGWTRLGLRRADGRSWTPEQQGLRARVLAPAGAGGPKFFTFANYDVIKRYNNSTSYALAVGLLSDALSGRSGVAASWPRDEQPLTRTEVKEMQRRLTALGYATQGVDGRVGPNTRKALRAWQADQGLPADAFPTQRVLERIRRQAGAAR